jgi:hypothetical protein
MLGAAPLGFGGPGTTVPGPGGAAEGGLEPGGPGGAADGARVGGPAGSPPAGGPELDPTRGIVLKAVGGVPDGGPPDRNDAAGVAVLDRGGGGGAAGAASGFCYLISIPRLHNCPGDLHL